MGGLGSGRSSYRTRATVEECISFPIGSITRLHKWFFKDANLSRGKVAGRIGWSRAGRETSSIGYTVTKGPVDIIMTLNYTYRNKSDPVEENIVLEPQSTPFGLRWWFRCPRCNRRAGKMYSPKAQKYFFCRHCFNLTYQSCIDSGESAFGRYIDELIKQRKTK